MAEADPADTLAHRPAGEVAVPVVVDRLAAGDQVTPVWRNQLGGLTFEVGDADHRRFVKWAKAGSGLDLDAERQRLQWASQYASVPRVLEYGSDADQSWLVTAAMAGESAVSDRWEARPETAVQAIGVQLRKLHDALPVEDCPFDWSVKSRLPDVDPESLPDDKMMNAPDWRPQFRGVSVKEALERATFQPEIDKLVVCHGDPCSPNTLIGDDGQPTGVVDLGALGVADRWADIAVATWSIEWNYGPGWEPTLLDAYGIDPDPDRSEYYRLLWDLG